jgi:hypothetical protein
VYSEQSSPVGQVQAHLQGQFFQFRQVSRGCDCACRPGHAAHHSKALFEARQIVLDFAERRARLDAADYVAVRVATDVTRPWKLSEELHDFYGIVPKSHQIAENQVFFDAALLFDIRKDRLQGDGIAVDVAKDCNLHGNLLSGYHTPQNPA